MKGICKVFFAGVCLFALVSMASVNASAQEKVRENRDSLGSIVRGPYETNKAWANWFIGVGGGINLLEDGGIDTKISGAVDAYVGKWFTPTIGARVGYSGFKFKGETSTGDLEGNFAYIHGDAMWNFSNAVSGYREDRFWDFIPYVSAGLLHGYGDVSTNNQFAVGGGLYNTLRLSKRVDLTIDIRQLAFKGTLYGTSGLASMTSATLGLNINLGKTKFKRATTIPTGYAAYSTDYVNDLKSKADQLASDNKRLADENGALKKRVGELEDEVSDLEKQLSEAGGNGKLDVTPAAVYFTIGQTTLSDAELSHLDFYAQNVIEQDPDATFVLTGYADKDTGGEQRNMYLSEKRVQYVADILTSKYNVSEDRLIIKAVGAESTYDSDNAALNRCVVLEYAE